MAPRIGAAPVRTPAAQTPARPRVAPVQARAQPQPQSLLQQGVSFFERNRAQIKSIAAAPGSIRSSIATGRSEARRITGTAAPTTPSVSRFTSFARDTFGRAPVRNVQTALRSLRAVNTVQSTVTGALRFPGQAITAGRDIYRAAMSGTAADRNQALASTRDAVTSARNVATGVSTVVRPPPGAAAPRTLLQRLRPPSGAREITTRAPVARAVRNTVRTLRTVAPRVTATLTNAATRLASTRGAQLATRVAGAGTRIATAAASRLASTTAGRIATTAATRLAESAAGRIAGRAAARFVPGANIAIAALDTAAAYRTWNDPHANTGQRVTSIVTAVGSWAAATNVPILSQAGAVVSTVSSIVGAFF